MVSGVLFPLPICVEHIENQNIEDNKIKTGETFIA